MAFCPMGVFGSRFVGMFQHTGLHIRCSPVKNRGHFALWFSCLKKTPENCVLFSGGFLRAAVYWSDVILVVLAIEGKRSRVRLFESPWLVYSTSSRFLLFLKVCVMGACCRSR